MADGALSSVVPNNAVPNVVEEKPDPIAQSQERINQKSADLQKQYDVLMEMLNERGNAQNRPISLTQFFASLAGSPESKYFSQSMGDVSRNLQGIQENQRRQELENAKMRMELSKSQLASEKEKSLQTAIGNLYKTTISPSGEEIQTINPQAVKAISTLTGNPQLAMQVFEQEKARRIETAKSNAFIKEIIPATDKEPEKTSFRFNPAAINNIFSVGGSWKDVSEIAKTIPEMRRAGMLSTSGIEGTPFDALAIMAPPEFKARAEWLQKQYKSGAFKDDESAEKEADKFMNLITQNQNHQQQLAFRQMVAGIQQSMQQETSNLRREQFEASQQKEKDKVIDKNQSAINSANDLIKSVEDVRNHPGRYSGKGSYDPRRLIAGTDEFNFDELMRKLKHQSFLSSVQQMRGLGALSNAEGQKIEGALAALNPAMSRSEFEKQLDIVVSTMNRAKEYAMKKISNLETSGTRPALRWDPKTQSFVQ